MNCITSLNIVRKMLLFVMAAAICGIVTAPAGRADVTSFAGVAGSIPDIATTRLNSGDRLVNFLSGDNSVGNLPIGWFDPSKKVAEPWFWASSRHVSGNPLDGILEFSLSHAGTLTVSELGTQGAEKLTTDKRFVQTGNPHTQLEGGPSVAEPGTLAMAGTGVIGLAGVLRRKLRV